MTWGQGWGEKLLGQARPPPQLARYAILASPGMGRAEKTHAVRLSYMFSPRNQQ